MTIDRDFKSAAVRALCIQCLHSDRRRVRVEDSIHIRFKVQIQQISTCKRKQIRKEFKTFL